MAVVLHTVPTSDYSICNQVDANKAPPGTNTDAAFSFLAATLEHFVKRLTESVVMCPMYVPFSAATGVTVTVTVGTGTVTVTVTTGSVTVSVTGNHLAFNRFILSAQLFIYIIFSKIREWLLQLYQSVQSEQFKENCTQIIASLFFATFLSQ